MNIQILIRSAFWAIRPGALDRAIDCLIHPQAAQEMQRAWKAAQPSVRGNDRHIIAVVPIEGVLTKDGPSWYGSSYDGISRAVSTAAANPDVKHIVLSIDSPGGEVTGAPETAAVIADAARVKPVTAMVHGMAASAAYWLGSQAREMVLTPSGEVGSVGVRMMHVDVSRMLDNAGFKVTELYSGDHKTEWSPFKPLSQDAIDAEMPRLQSVHQDFINAVSSARGERLSRETRKDRLGEGRMFSARDAIRHGLADRVQSAHEFYRAIMPPQAAGAFPIRGQIAETDSPAELNEF